MFDSLFVFIYEIIGYHEMVEDDMMTQEDIDFLEELKWIEE